MDALLNHRPARNRARAVILAVTLAAGTVTLALAQEGGESPVGQAVDATTPAQRIAAAIREVFQALPPERADYGTAMFTDPKRYVWDYRPATRSGLPLFALESDDRDRLWHLLDTTLGESGAATARKVMDHERRLYETTRDESRDPEWYFLAMFGIPEDTGQWGFRFEGNHLSVNLTVSEGEVIGTTPLFMGAQPASASPGRAASEGPLSNVARAGRTLLEALTDQQRRRAVFSATPPDDILTGSSDRASRTVMLGIRYAELDEAQRGLLLDLIRSYAGRWEPDLAAAEVEALEAAGLDEVRFGWAGPTTPQAAFYYRVQGRDFIIEYGHVDGDLDHVHSVWRKFDDDFGRRALQEVRRQTTTMAPLGAPAGRAPATTEETEAAAAEAVRKLALVGEEVPPNACLALVEITDRRPLLPSDPLPRTVQRDVDLEVLTLRVIESTDQPDLENRCEVDAEVDAISPQHPSRLIGRTARLYLELVGDTRGSVWQASRIQLQR